jgi:hypothetical protein
MRPHSAPTYAPPHAAPPSAGSPRGHAPGSPLCAGGVGSARGSPVAWAPPSPAGHRARIAVPGRRGLLSGAAAAGGAAASHLGDLELSVARPDPLQPGRTDSGAPMFRPTPPTDPYGLWLWNGQAARARAGLARAAAAAGGGGPRRPGPSGRAGSARFGSQALGTPTAAATLASAGMRGACVVPGFSPPDLTQVRAAPPSTAPDPAPRTAPLCTARYG